MRRATLVLLAGAIAITACSGPGEEFLGPWTGPSGEPVGDNYRSQDGFTMASDRGPEQCNWESVIFLEIAWPPGAVLRVPNEPGSSRVFVRDPNGAFEFDRGGFSPDAALPADAESTGFTHDAWELWTSHSQDGYVFLVSRDLVERWPQSEEVGCD